MITQGNQGEVLALEWLGMRYKVAIPLGHSSDWDMAAEIDGQLARVQVKTCARAARRDRFEVRLATCGGNQSWNRIVKRFSPERYDYLYVHTGPGRRWFIPASAIEGTVGIILGGPKYAEYEVDPGPPLSLS